MQSATLLSSASANKEFVDFAYFVLTNTYSQPSVHAVASVNNPNLLNDTNFLDSSNSASRGEAKLPKHYCELAKLNRQHIIDLRYYVQHCENSIMRHLTFVVNTVFEKYKPTIEVVTHDAIKSVYAEPEVFADLKQVLINAYFDYRLFGVAVFAFPRDLIKWATDQRVWRNKTDTQGRVPGDPRGIAWLQMARSQKSPLVPFSSIPLENGQVTAYSDTQTNRDVYLFSPQTPYAQALAKNFRFAVYVNPSHKFTNHGITTGLAELYDSWVQYQLCLISVQQTDAIASRPAFITQINLADKTDKEMTDDDIASSVVTLPDVGTLQPSELVTLLARKKVSYTQAVKIVQMMEASETQRPVTVLSAANLTDTDASDMHSPFLSHNFDHTRSVDQLTPRDIDLLRFKAHNLPILSGQMRDQFIVPMPIGTELRTVIPGKAPYETLKHLQKNYEHRLSDLYGTTEVMGSFTTAHMVTSAENDIQLRHLNTTIDNAKITIAGLFDWLYVECGIVVEMVDLSETLNITRQRLAKMGALKILRDYLLDKQKAKQTTDILTPDIGLEAIVANTTTDKTADDSDNNRQAKNVKTTAAAAATDDSSQVIDNTIMQLLQTKTGEDLHKTMAGIERLIVFLETILFGPQQLGIIMKFTETGNDNVLNPNVSAQPTQKTQHQQKPNSTTL